VLRELGRTLTGPTGALLWGTARLATGSEPSHAHGVSLPWQTAGVW